jgi:hypothetical protein
MSTPREFILKINPDYLKGVDSLSRTKGINNSFTHIPTLKGFWKIIT